MQDRGELQTGEIIMKDKIQDIIGAVILLATLLFLVYGVHAQENDQQIRWRDYSKNDNLPDSTYIESILPMSPRELVKLLDEYLAFCNTDSAMILNGRAIPGIHDYSYLGHHEPGFKDFRNWLIKKYKIERGK